MEKMAPVLRLSQPMTGGPSLYNGRSLKLRVALNRYSMLKKIVTYVEGTVSQRRCEIRLGTRPAAKADRGDNRNSIQTRRLSPTHLVLVYDPLPANFLDGSAGNKLKGTTQIRLRAI